jgi:hypothetical protein
MAIEPSELRKRILDGLNSPLVQVLDSKGITLDVLADKLKEELDATETKTFQHQGKVIESEPKVAWDVRQRARQDAHKLRSDYPVERKHVSFEGGVPIVPLSEEEQVELEAMKEAIRARKAKENSL